MADDFRQVLVDLLPLCALAGEMGKKVGRNSGI